MYVLIACEESQRVCGAFRAKGHEAYSCDIQEPSGGHPEWHILGDVLPILRGGQFVTMDGTTHFIEKWDMIIAHPPCTYLSNAGANHLFKRIDGESYIKKSRFELGLDAKEFFMNFYNCDCEKIAIENSTPSGIYRLPKYTQAIQPYEFGEPYSKRTCLWLKGLPKLEPTNIVEPIASWVNCRQRKENGGVSFRDGKTRSKTFIGIANAMASQWG